MITHKEIHLEVYKEYDYKPISEEEKRRISKDMTYELIELAERFDGPVVIKIFIEARGNC